MGDGLDLAVLAGEVAADEGIAFSQSLYTNDPDAAIQWPFKVGVAMSSGYGQRWGRLHAIAVGAATVAFIVGMTIAVVTGRPLY